MEWSMPPPGVGAGGTAGGGARDMQRDAAAATATHVRVLRRLYRVHDDERAWRLGAEGEEEVARRLSKLGPTWTVLHDLPLARSGANLDHLVIGPGGVFALNTKYLTGKVWVGQRMVLHNGRRTSFLPACRREAATTADLLAAAAGRAGPVTPVLVVMCHELTIKQQPVDVPVVGRRGIARWLEGQPATLTPETVRCISDAARRASTWPVTSPK
jgi:hypothetical protein